MDTLESLKNGDRVRIKGKDYEVLYLRYEIAPNRKRYPPIRQYLAVYLHDNKHEMLSPTHVLRCFLDTGEMFLVHMVVEKVGREEVKRV